MRKNFESAAQVTSVLNRVFAVALIAMSSGSARAMEVYAMRDAPNAQTSPGITQYSSISNFRSNTSGTTTNRSISQGSSCDFAIVNGVVYSISGDASLTGNKDIYSWPSIADWAANTNTSNLGTRTNAAPMSGMAIYQGSLYVLEGDMTQTTSKTLKRWSSPASWAANEAPAETFASRTVGDGIGFDIDTDGVVYFLDSDASPNTATSGILYSWPSISAFIADTPINNNGGTFTFFSGSPNEIAGLAVVPEPSTWILAGIASLAVPMISRRRTQKIRKS